VYGFLGGCLNNRQFKERSGDIALLCLPRQIVQALLRRMKGAFEPVIGSIQGDENREAIGGDRTTG
jgi:hypothetical protein